MQPTKRGPGRPRTRPAPQPYTTEQLKRHPQVLVELERRHPLLVTLLGPGGDPEPVLARCEEPVGISASDRLTNQVRRTTNRRKATLRAKAHHYLRKIAREMWDAGSMQTFEQLSAVPVSLVPPGSAVSAVMPAASPPPAAKPVLPDIERITLAEHNRRIFDRHYADAMATLEACVQRRARIDHYAARRASARAVPPGQAYGRV